MKTGLTHIIFVVDRSGSMRSIAKDMIGGYNEYIEKQKKTPGECFVSFYQFDDIYEPIFERVKLQDVKDLDGDTYKPRNSTALLDAVGNTIVNYGKYLSELQEDARPERILFVTITDGEENASHVFDITKVRDMVKHQTDVYKWDFVFLGSNIDAWDAGQSIGVARCATLQFANTKGSVGAAFKSLSDQTSGYRSSSSKIAYAFTAADYAAQDDQLVGNQKAKNRMAQAAAAKSTKSTTK